MLELVERSEGEQGQLVGGQGKATEELVDFGGHSQEKEGGWLEESGSWQVKGRVLVMWKEAAELPRWLRFGLHTLE